MKKKSIVLILYIIVISFGAYHHEPWRDEAHVWLTARDSSLPELFWNAHIVGTPILWNIVLMPWAKLGMPYETMAIVHVILASVAALLLLFFSRIPLITRIFFLFSYYLAFEYAVVARNYILTIVLLFALASLYPRRFIQPLYYSLCIFLLYQTNSFSFVPASVLSFLFAGELYLRQRLSLMFCAACFIMMAGLFVALFQLYPPPLYTAAPINTRGEIPRVISEGIIPSSLVILPKSIGTEQPTAVFFWGTCIVLSLYLVLVVKQPVLLGFTGAAVGWWLYVNTIVHAGTLRHHGLLLVMLFFSWWILRADGRKRNKFFSKIEMVFTLVLTVLLFVSCIITGKMYALDYALNFSGAKDMGQYMKKNTEDALPIVSFRGGYGEAVLPYVGDKTFWYPELATFGTHILHTTDYMLTASQISTKEALEKAETKFSPSGYYLLLSSELPPTESSRYHFLHQSSAPYFWSNETESFWLYQRLN